MTAILNHAAGLNGSVRHSCGDQEEYGLANFVESHSSFPHGAEDGGKVAIGDHHIRSFFGHIRALPPHGHSDVGRLQSRGVVDPVSGHSHNLPSLHLLLDDAQFMVGSHPSIQRNLGCPEKQALVAPPQEPGDYLGSTGSFAFSHPSQPPFKTKTLSYPRDKNCRATQALVSSLGQEQ